MAKRIKDNMGVSEGELGSTYCIIKPTGRSEEAGRCWHVLEPALHESRVGGEGPLSDGQEHAKSRELHHQQRLLPGVNSRVLHEANPEW